MGKEHWKELLSSEIERADQRLSMSYGERAELAELDLTRELLGLMEEKESNLVVAADKDFESFDEALDFAERVGPEVVAIKFHPRMFPGWLSEEYDKLLFEAGQRGLDFFVINDTKIDDIGKIAFKQAFEEMYKAHMVTALTAAGGKTLEAINDAAEKLYDSDGISRGSIPMLYMTPEGHLFDKLFDDAIDHANQYDAVGGVVAGKSLDALYHAMARLNLGILIFSPGIGVSGEKGERGQTYGHPYHAVLHGTDLIIVGSGIYGAEDPLEAAKVYREQGWEGYQARLKG